MRNRLIFIILSLLIFDARGGTILKIQDQESFNKLQQSLIENINAGENELYVIFSAGLFVAKENHIDLRNIDSPSLKLHFIGDNAMIVPSGKVYHSGDFYTTEFSPFRSWMNGTKDIEIWSKIRYAEGLVEVMDEKEKKCRIKTTDNYVSNIDCSRVYILIPHWYQSSIGKVEKIEDNYIYFTMTDLKRSVRENGKDYNLNDDKSYGKLSSVRYKLCNVESDEDKLRIIDGKLILPHDVDFVREGCVSRLLCFQNIRFASVEFKGLNFCGSSYITSGAAIVLKDMECKEIIFNNCGFYGMKNNVIEGEGTDNVKVEQCVFEDCYHSGIRMENNCKNIQVINNTFTRIGKRMTQSFCMILRGEKYYASGNKMTNYGYGGIGVGISYKMPQTCLCNGFIENNTLSYTKDYLANIPNYGLMDSGAIYLWTKNDGAIIRRNIINGYGGMKDNRGVFCDDGAYGFELYENIINGVKKGNFCIDSRRVPEEILSNKPNYEIDNSNVNIIIRDNIIDGPIQFVANECKNNGCVKGRNFVLLKSGEVVPQNVIGNLTIQEDDILVNYENENNAMLVFSDKNYKLLQKYGLKKMIKKIVKRSKDSPYKYYLNNE